MRLGGSSYKTVFLLGAGASRGALKHVLHNGKRLKPPLNWDFFKVADTFARAEGQHSAARRRLDHLLKAFKQDLPVHRKPTMEEAFSLLYVAKDFPEIYRKGPGKKPVAGERKEIDDFFHLLFPILTKLDRGNDQATGYDRLAGEVESGDTLITLNYDTMLDSALHRRAWDPKSGYVISGTTGKVSWPATTGPLGESALKVKLIKLHGSTNWFVRGSTSNLKKVFSSKPVMITKPRENEIAGHIRQIVPPIYGKIFEHDHWRHLWTKAFNDLCEAEIFVVVGSSLIDTDFHLRALLSQVVRTRKKRQDKFARVYLVDKVTVRRKWQSVLKGSFAKVYACKTFEGFLRQELRV